ncbi:MAG: hypothetical protein JNJ54_11730 [Myxococcaceae bacterium]|nr:hypothetical protein [Myxococcaceae bacterium]
MTPAHWMEVVFNLTYLVVIFGLVIAMSARLTEDRLQHRLRNGFLLLAVGDTGHVGFRVVALLRGGLDSRADVLGLSVPLVGIGALSTAITVTLVYLLLLDTWRVRFGAARTWWYWSLAAMAVVRFALFLAPQNEWGNVVPPWEWSVLRNVPLTILGLGVAALMIRDGRRAGDATFTQLGWLIVGSYAFYLPVILFVQRVPPIGMLMIPKTLMYVAMAWLAYSRLFKPADVHPPRAATVP